MTGSNSLLNFLIGLRTGSEPTAAIIYCLGKGIEFYAVGLLAFGTAIGKAYNYFSRYFID